MSVAPPTRSRLRFTLLVVLGVYPMSTMLLYAVMPLTQDWEIWQRNIVMVPITVAGIIWWLVPRIHRHFSGFIER